MSYMCKLGIFLNSVYVCILLQKLLFPKKKAIMYNDDNDGIVAGVDVDVDDAYQQGLMSD